MVTAKGHLSGQIPTRFPTRFPWKIANKSPFLSPFSGWWLTYYSEKYDFVSWDDDIPNIWKNVQAMFQTTKQYITIIFPLLLVYTLLTTITVTMFFIAMFIPNSQPGS